MKQLLVSTSFFSFQEAIAEEAARSGQSVDEVRAEAVAILKMMAHNWGLNSTRAFGYAVTKVLEVSLLKCKHLHYIILKAVQENLRRYLCECRTNQANSRDLQNRVGGVHAVAQDLPRLPSSLAFLLPICRWNWQEEWRHEMHCPLKEVPLPAIAAGMDFTNSWFMSEVLRRSGAFYIRRSIGQVSAQGGRGCSSLSISLVLVDGYLRI